MSRFKKKLSLIKSKPQLSLMKSKAPLSLIKSKIVSKIKLKMVTSKTAVANGGAHSGGSDAQWVGLLRGGVIVALTTAAEMHGPVDLTVYVVCL